MATLEINAKPPSISAQNLAEAINWSSGKVKVWNEETSYLLKTELQKVMQIPREELALEDN